MLQVYKRAAARPDLIEHYVYLAENAGEETADRFLTEAEQTFVELARRPEIGAPRTLRPELLQCEHGANLTGVEIKSGTTVPLEMFAPLEAVARLVPELRTGIVLHGGALRARRRIDFEAQARWPVGPTPVVSPRTHPIRGRTARTAPAILPRRPCGVRYHAVQRPRDQRR
jgi:plasmid stabilization system protein ParE